MTGDALTFSLIVNTTDRAGPLRTLLRALEQQSYPHFEVVVVVGPTRDNTMEMLADYADRVRVLRCAHANLSESRNIGLLAARGDLVAYIDDDAVPCYHWLEHLSRLFADPHIDATGGVVYMIHPQEAIIQHRIGLMSSMFEHYDVRASWLEHLAPAGLGSQWAARMMGTNMAFRRVPLLDVGGFDEFYVYIGEETDVMLRMVNAGYTVYPVKESPVYHVPASSRNRTMFSAYGRWWMQTRSGTYFTIKNGRSAGDPAGRILLRCLYLIHGHWLAYGQSRRERKITFTQLWRMRLGELYAITAGTLAGLRPQRPLIDEATRKAAMHVSEPILPFQNAASAYQGAVNPISGRQPLRALPDPPLRLCLLSGAYPPEQYDGVGRLTNLMAQGLHECGHTVHVIARGEREAVSFYDGAFVHRIPYQAERYSVYRRFPGLFHTLNYSHAVYEKVRRMLSNDGIQLVDSPIWQYEGLVTAMSGIAPTVVRLVTASPQLARIHADAGEEPRLMAEMERALIARAQHILPNTAATLAAARDLYGAALLEGRSTLVPYGIVPAPDEAARPFNLQQPPERLTVLFVGRLEKRKGIMDLFEAIPLVLQKLPNVKFILAGQDNSHSDGFQRQTGQTYPAYFAEHFGKYAAHVEFTGMVSDATLQSLYQSCDLFVAPSLYESFGLIYLEAMNYAKPVVGCRAGGVPEVVAHGETGLLADPGAPAALAEALLTLLQTPAKLYEMGVAGRRRLLEHFTYLQMARNFEKVYRAVLAQH